MAREDRKRFAFEVRRYNSLENLRATRLLVEHGSYMREERSASHKRIVGVASIDVIGAHVKSHPGFESGPKVLAVEARHLCFRSALREFKEQVLRRGARGLKRAVQLRQLFLALALIGQIGLLAAFNQACRGNNGCAAAAGRTSPPP